MSSNTDILLIYLQTVPIHIPFRVFVELEEVKMGTLRKSNLFIFNESAIYSQGYGLLNSTKAIWNFSPSAPALLLLPVLWSSN